LCARRDGAPPALVVCTSDAGLCGSYNTNLIQLAEATLRQDGRRPIAIMFIGKKGYRYFTKRGYSAVESYVDLAGRPNPRKTEAIGRSLMDRFLSGQVSSVSVLHSQFISAMVYRPIVQQWLPIQLNSGTQAPRHPGTDEYIFEPSARAVFEDLLPRWALATFQLMLLEAFTSEHSARMIAMKNATDNAEKLVGELTLQRNKIRQATITKEISEIVGTVEALK
jgi:F-type H+-transporting ATPase subunit gamma